MNETRHNVDPLNYHRTKVHMQFTSLPHMLWLLLMFVHDRDLTVPV